MSKIEQMLENEAYRKVSKRYFKFSYTEKGLNALSIYVLSKVIRDSYRNYSLFEIKEKIRDKVQQILSEDVKESFTEN